MFRSADEVYRLLLKVLEMEGNGSGDENTFSVTEVCSCLRKAWYARVKGKRFTEQQAALLLMGRGAHSAFEEAVKKVVGDGVEVEVSCEMTVEVNGKKLVLKGRADMVTDDCIVELKTCSKVPDRPYKDHVRQLNAYLYMLGREKGQIIYVSRDGRITLFDIRKDNRIVAEVIARLQDLALALERKQPPPPERGPLCDLCPYKLECMTEGKRKSAVTVLLESLVKQ